MFIHILRICHINVCSGSQNNLLCYIIIPASWYYLLIFVIVFEIYAPKKLVAGNVYPDQINHVLQSINGSSAELPTQEGGEGRGGISTLLSLSSASRFL